MKADQEQRGEVFVVPLSEDESEWLSFRPTYDGWAVYRSQAFDADRAWLFLRFGLDRGRTSEAALVGGKPTVIERPTDEQQQAWIEVREVLVSFSGGGVAARVLRDIPLTRIEAGVNQPAYRSHLLPRLPGPSMTMQPFEWDPPEKSSWWFAVPHPFASPVIKMDVPEGRGRPDSFYEAVAAAFGYLSTVSSRPAAEMADANKVPVTTVHGWVKEARRRGLLPAGERAKRED